MAVNDKREEHGALARRAAAEGMVLLRNEGHLLPLKAQTKVAVFGIGQVHTIYGGTGSGEVNNLRSVDILAGLRASTLIVDEDLAAQYEAWAKDHPRVRQGMFAGGKSQNYNEEMPVQDVEKWARRNAAAVVVISRIAGEGEDMQVQRGMILLTEAEETLLQDVISAFSSTVLVLNTAGYMEIASWLPKLNSVVFAGLPGQEAGHAVADILTGAVPVGGKLSSTWPLSCQDYANSEQYSTFIPSGNVCAGGFDTVPVEQTLVPYHDDIYVGYRYFDSFGRDVLYPFGYGLSYGSPVMSGETVSLEGETITVTAEVKNESDTFAATQVVQVYVCAPEGKLEKPFQELKGFKKTAVLAPGQSERVQMTISLRDLASYDMTSAAYILESGNYKIRVGSSSRESKVCGILQVNQAQVTMRVKNLMGKVPEGFDLLSRDGISPIALEADNVQKDSAFADTLTVGGIETKTVAYPDLTGQERHQSLLTPSAETHSAEASSMEAPASSVSQPVSLKDSVTLQDVISGQKTLSDLTASMETRDLCRMVCGQGMDMSAFDLSAMQDLIKDRQEGQGKGEGEEETAGSTDIFAALAFQEGGEPSRFEVTGEAGQSPDFRKEYGIPPLVLADGPAGVRLTRDLPDGSHQYCTAFPTGSLLACTFNPETLEAFGEAVGEEMNAYGVDLWLAPGMNIHRNPLCGRNFEYFSEDPLVTGKCAAAITRGVQRMGGGVTIKHFAGNNQEFLRGNSNDLVSERALREIYLKGFEICVKEGHPKAVMTSYNDINGVPSADNQDLLTAILRDEWGFDGLVMTDWGGGVSQPAVSVCVGNDMIQPGGTPVVQKLYEAVMAGEKVASRGMAHREVKPSREALEISAQHILHVILKSKSAMARLGD